MGTLTWLWSDSGWGHSQLRDLLTRISDGWYWHRLGSHVRVASWSIYVFLGSVCPHCMVTKIAPIPRVDGCSKTAGWRGYLADLKKHIARLLLCSTGWASRGTWRRECEPPQTGDSLSYKGAQRCDIRSHIWKAVCHSPVPVHVTSLHITCKLYPVPSQSHGLTVALV